MQFFFQFHFHKSYDHDVEMCNSFSSFIFRSLKKKLSSRRRNVRNAMIRKRFYEYLLGRNNEILATCFADNTSFRINCELSFETSRCGKGICDKLENLVVSLRNILREKFPGGKMSPGASAIFGDKLFEKILFMNVENHK